MNIDLKIKNLKLKIRDAYNKLTGKDKVIKEYTKTTYEIAHMSDKEKNPKIKKKLMDLYQKVTDEKWEERDGALSVNDYNPYTGSKKTTHQKTEMAQTELSKIIKEKTR